MPMLSEAPHRRTLNMRGHRRLLAGAPPLASYLRYRGGTVESHVSG